MDDIKQRLAALEDSVARVVRVLGGIEYLIKTAREAPAECEFCGRDPATVKECAHDCPLGL